jgi:hypothetical protein
MFLKAIIAVLTASRTLGHNHAAQPAGAAICHKIFSNPPTATSEKMSFLKKRKVNSLIAKAIGSESSHLKSFAMGLYETANGERRLTSSFFDKDEAYKAIHHQKRTGAAVFKPRVDALTEEMTQARIRIDKSKVDEQLVVDHAELLLTSKNRDPNCDKCDSPAGCGDCRPAHLGGQKHIPTIRSPAFPQRGACTGIPPM